MSAIMYDLRIERARRELANIYNVPVRKVQQVEKGLLSFYIYFDQASGFDTPFILTAVSDGEIMFESDGKLSPEEIKEELALFKEHGYYTATYEPEEEFTYSPEDYEALRTQMSQFASLDNLSPTAAGKILDDLLEPKPE